MTQGVGHEATRLLGVSRAFNGSRMVPGDVLIGNGQVLELGVGEGVGDLIAAPGFVDLQLNGFGGVDLQTASPESLDAMRQRLALTGVTSFQPTLISAPVESLVRRLDVFDSMSRDSAGSPMLPVHLEGPFLSRKFRGAHRAEYLQLPSASMLDRLMEPGNVGCITLAPELPGALELIGRARDRGAVVAIGHTDATAEEATAGFRAGATVLTHAFNAHRRFAPRDPGPIAAALVARAWLTVIADGIHLAPLTVLMLESAGGGRLVTISDAMVAAGMGDGSFRYGDLDVVVRQGVAELSDGRLAGSTATLDAELRFLVEVGVPVESALASVTSRPGGVLASRELGRLVKGGPADIVILDGQLYPVKTFVAGEEIYDAERAAR